MAILIGATLRPPSPSTSRAARSSGPSSTSTLARPATAATGVSAPSSDRTPASTPGSLATPSSRGCTPRSTLETTASGSLRPLERSSVSGYLRAGSAVATDESLPLFSRLQSLSCRSRTKKAQYPVLFVGFYLISSFYQSYTLASVMCDATLEVRKEGSSRCSRVMLRQHVSTQPAVRIRSPTSPASRLRAQYRRQGSLRPRVSQRLPPRPVLRWRLPPLPRVANPPPPP